ncbi:MAG TPA: fumarylacetoacetate hydrolase family protein [Candidatus Dormibacteraeota bacterium]|jgi:2-keto-4-pentenoate hydratase/2-oxohepta-3-ene-1,7-dioic acid hydratase in catechol pathway|nr:fumarylacetoacetate hydrolase family protein [Candidatus Dormibacteraeota bacterium]
MILLHYVSNGSTRLAVKTAQGVFDAGGTTLDDIFSGQAPSVTGDPLDEGTLVYAPSVPRPGKIVCVGHNYRKHVEESGAEMPENPVLFSKYLNALTASGQDVPIPSVTTQCDYEAELVIVIGRHAERVSEANATDYVFGYSNGNDISARDLQRLTPQWMLGKTLTKFGPVGPYLCSREEMGSFATQPIRCSVNGELRQDSVLGDMIFGVPELVSFISRHFPLDPGDIIFSGTPSGVAMGREDKPWLKPGDEVVVEVGPLGRLVSHMVEGD